MKEKDDGGWAELVDYAVNRLKKLLEGTGLVPRYAGDFVIIVDEKTGITERFETHMGTAITYGQGVRDGWDRACKHHEAEREVFSADAKAAIERYLERFGEFKSETVERLHAQVKNDIAKCPRCCYPGKMFDYTLYLTAWRCPKCGMEYLIPDDGEKLRI